MSEVSKGRREFSVGEVVYAENFGWGVVSQTQYDSFYLKIVFERANDADWWWSADRVLKLEDVTKLQGEVR
jgi:hypothetical protein